MTILLLSMCILNQAQRTQYGKVSPMHKEQSLWHALKARPNLKRLGYFQGGTENQKNQEAESPACLENSPMF